MRQVIFSRMRPAGGRWNVSGCGYACRTMIGASPGCRGQWGAACDPSRQSGLRAELPPVPHHHRPSPPRVADSPARDAGPSSCGTPHWPNAFGKILRQAGKSLRTQQVDEVLIGKQLPQCTHHK